MEIAIIIAVVSIAFSVISLIFTFLRFGINITQEFCERPDVIERKEKLEIDYRERLNEDWRILINAYPEKVKLGDEAVGAFFKFWTTAPLINLPSRIIDKISSFTEQIISDFIYIILSIFGVAVSYFLQINFPDFLIFDEYQKIGMIGGMFLMSLVFGYHGIIDMKNTIPRIIQLRRQFFELSVSADLEELQEVSDKLENENIL